MTQVVFYSEMWGLEAFYFGWRSVTSFIVLLAVWLDATVLERNGADDSIISVNESQTSSSDFAMGLLCFASVMLVLYPFYWIFVVNVIFEDAIYVADRNLEEVLDLGDFQSVLELYEFGVSFDSIFFDDTISRRIRDANRNPTQETKQFVLYNVKLCVEMFDQCFELLNLGELWRLFKLFTPNSIRFIEVSCVCLKHFIFFVINVFVCHFV